MSAKTRANVYFISFIFLPRLCQKLWEKLCHDVTLQNNRKLHILSSMDIYFLSLIFSFFNPKIHILFCLSSYLHNLFIIFVKCIYFILFFIKKWSSISFVPNGHITEYESFYALKLNKYFVRVWMWEERICIVSSTKRHAVYIVFFKYVSRLSYILKFFALFLPAYLCIKNFCARINSNGENVNVKMVNGHNVNIFYRNF